MALTLVGTYTGNFAGLSLHANFVVDETNIHVVHNNVIQDFALTTRGGNPLAFVRNTARDVTLAGHPTSIQTWGFTESHFGTHDGEWIILTRERNVAEATIGKVRVYSHDGSQRMLEFDIPSTVSGISGETFRAPKTVSEIGGFYFVRVVRSVPGNMRFLVFDEAGVVRPDLTLTLAESTPSALRDASSESETGLYILSQGSPVGTVIPFHPQTGEEIPNERAVGTDIANAEAISVFDGDLFVANVTSIIRYTGVPDVANTLNGSGGGGGGGFGIFQILAANAMMNRNMNLRERRRRDEERRRRFGG